MSNRRKAHVHYRAKVLSDGHIPLPETFRAKTGEEIEVTVVHSTLELSDKKVGRRTEYFLKKWIGVGRGSGSGVAGRHDDYLYGDDT